MKDKIYNEWIKINVELHNKLEELNKLDKERNMIISKFKNKELSYEEKLLLVKSSNKYSVLLEEVIKLNKKSDELKKMIIN